MLNTSKTSLAPPELLENKSFDEIMIGDSASLTRVVHQKDINLFALVSGDVNPLHVDVDYVTNVSQQPVTGHAMWSGALISTLLGTQLPGPGTVQRGQTLSFVKPITVGDTITVTVTVKEKISKERRIIFDCLAVNQHNEAVCIGTAEVNAPSEKIKRQRVKLPQVHLDNVGTQLQRLIAMTEEHEPIVTAVVHPVDSNSLRGAIEAAQKDLIVPVLVGPRSRIRAVAKEEGIDISPYRLIDTEHSHEAALEAVSMARAGKVQALLKGSLHTDELMAAVVQRGTGISTSRRMSHVFLMDVPTYPRPLLVTDGAINIDPTLDEKRDIVQNAIELAHAMKIEKPRVALLSAVETVNSKMRSTLEAAAICKMSHRKQIVGGIVDGPLAFDNAVSLEAVRIKGIDSEVSGRADILVAPDLEAGNMLAKQLEYMAGAQSSGIVLGARVPIALTSRADTVLSRMASCALAALLVYNYKKLAP